MPAIGNRRSDCRGSRVYNSAVGGRDCQSGILFVISGRRSAQRDESSVPGGPFCSAVMTLPQSSQRRKSTKPGDDSLATLPAASLRTPPHELQVGEEC